MVEFWATVVAHGDKTIALHLDVPKYVDDTQNPAERWIDAINAELGFTEPRLNGTSMLTRRSRYGAAVGGGEQWEINTDVGGE